MKLIKMLTVSARCLRVGPRSYSTKASIKGPSKSRFDKSMIKPAVIIILFGSMLTNLMEQQKKNAEMERLYSMKIAILRDLVKRVKEEDDLSFDVKEELRLVNKSFERYENSQSVDLENEAQKARARSENNSYSKNSVITSLNAGLDSKTEDESLAELFKDIMQDIEMEVSDGQKGLEHVSKPAAQKLDPDSDEVIVTNAKRLTEEAEKERTRLNYKASTDTHVIVENPGEYSTAAEERKVSKFL